jgi:pilus assembly protein Flp/PilA
MKHLMIAKSYIAAKRQKGVTLIEYALIAALIAIAAIVVLGLIGDEVNALFGRVKDAVNGG